jgi:hypothetical protein
MGEVEEIMCRIFVGISEQKNLGKARSKFNNKVKMD